MHYFWNMFCYPRKKPMPVCGPFLFPTSDLPFMSRDFMFLDPLGNNHVMWTLGWALLIEPVVFKSIYV